MEKIGKSSEKNLDWNFTFKTGQFEVQGATIHICIWVAPCTSANRFIDKDFAVSKKQSNFEPEMDAE
jgi:hypothetical protein